MGSSLSCEPQEQDGAVQATYTAHTGIALLPLRSTMPAGHVPSRDPAQPCCCQDPATLVRSGSLSQPHPWDLQSTGLNYPEQSWPRTCLEITSRPGRGENPINCLVALWFLCLLHLSKYSSRVSLSKLQLGWHNRPESMPGKLLFST